MPAILLGAHYDTTDVPGYLGANNSATGVGAVIAIATRAEGRSRSANRAAVRFVLFDGEEAPTGYHDFYAEGLRGSRAYAAAHAKETREAIVLDFIALHDEQLSRDPSSDAALWSRLRAAAARAGTLDLFPDTTQGARARRPHALRPGLDPGDRPDRLPLPVLAEALRRPDKVSQKNLTRVGATVLELLRAERLR